MNKAVGLSVSVLLNLFLLAVIGGHIWRAHEMSDNATPLVQALAHAREILPPEDAAAFAEVVRRDWPRFTLAIIRLRRARENLNEQIIAEPFNPAATRQALAAAQSARSQFVDDFSGTLVEALAKVSPQGRNKLVAEAWLGGRRAAGDSTK